MDTRSCWFCCYKFILKFTFATLLCTGLTSVAALSTPVLVVGLILLPELGTFEEGGLLEKPLSCGMGMGME